MALVALWQCCPQWLRILIIIANGNTELSVIFPHSVRPPGWFLQFLSYTGSYQPQPLGGNSEVRSVVAILH